MLGRDVIYMYMCMCTTECSFYYCDCVSVKKVPLFYLYSHVVYMDIHLDMGVSVYYKYVLPDSWIYAYSIFRRNLNLSCLSLDRTTNVSEEVACGVTLVKVATVFRFCETMC